MIDLFLQNISDAHSRRHISKLERLINEFLYIIPIPILDVRANVPIQRVRNNYKGEIFNSEEEISFRSDCWNIKEFGRANFPYSSRFYASLHSKYIKKIRVANVLETNKEFTQYNIGKRQVFTSGEWLTIKPLKVAIFPFNKNAFLFNNDIKFDAEKFNHIINNFTDEQKKTYRKVLKFISYYYALKNIQNHYDYSVSTFVSELLFDKYRLDGILYPSVRAQYKTYNIVMEPKSVINKMKLNKAAMFELFIYRKNIVIDNIAYADISDNDNLFWNYTERTSEKIINDLL